MYTYIHFHFTYSYVLWCWNNEYTHRITNIVKHHKFTVSNATEAQETGDVS